MTNKKICDVCNQEIPKRVDYIKLTLIKHNGKMQEYVGIGHMCLACLELHKDLNKLERQSQ